MKEFWEEHFIEKQEMWGFEPARSALITRDYFKDNCVKNLLIPGIGYGRNAQVFKQIGIDVTGIEISQTAIDLARKHYGSGMVIHHGSVTEMPFDTIQYDGIFCHALIHLLNSKERAALIAGCYDQLIQGGLMVFTTITKEAPTYGQGKYISKDRYGMFGGITMFFYDRETIQEEFGRYGLIEVTEVNENYPFYLIKCKKM